MAKEFRGIEVNLCMFQGKIIEDPVINGDYVFMKLRTVTGYRDADGNYTDMDQVVQLMVEPSGPVRVARNYIKEGRKLMAWTSYKTFQDGNGVINHVFSVNRIDLGDKPYEPPTQ